MRNIKLFFVLPIALLSLLFLTGCNSFVSVKSDFERAGYTYSEEANQYVEGLMEEFQDKELVVKPHLFYHGLNYAIVLEFRSVKEMEAELEKSEALKGLVKDLQKSDYVRGNCLLIPVGIDRQEMIDIFQGRR